jgi:hypothetical protein
MSTDAGTATLDLRRPDIAEVTREVAATLDEVWQVLDDGWLYPLWVVGASRMRDVDASWPEVGARLHHSVGTWPLLLDDKTEVLEVEHGRQLRLKAHSWPAGAAEVLIETSAIGTGTRVSIREDASDGPGTLVPRFARQIAMVPRNTEALKRFAFVAEGRATKPRPARNAYTATEGTCAISAASDTLQPPSISSIALFNSSIAADRAISASRRCAPALRNRDRSWSSTGGRSRRWAHVHVLSTGSLCP